MNPLCHWFPSRPAIQRPASLFFLLAALCALPPLAHAAPQVFDSNQAGLWILTPQASSDFARPLAAGDFDGDGIDDIVIGQSNSPNVANVHVIQGASRPWNQTPAILDLSTTPATKRIIGVDPTINLPTALAVGDINGDGYTDLAMSAPITSPLGRSDAGTVYVVFGGPDFFAPPAILDLTNPGAMGVFAFYGVDLAGDLGSQSAFSGMDAEGIAIGDLNGDGIDDIAIGAHLASPSSRSAAGRVYVVYGRTTFTGGQTFDLASANIRFDGARNYYETGTRLKIGDITGDGIGDLIIPCDIAGEQTFFLSSEGIVYVFRGRPSASWAATYDLRTAAPELKILGRRDGDGLGSSVALADMNRDGILDLCLGAEGGGSQPALADDFGAVAIFFGGAALGTLPRTHNMAVTPPSLEWTGPQAYSNMGWALATGDFDGSGFHSLASSAVFADAPGETINGFIEVLRSRPSWSAAALVKSSADEHDYRVFGPINGRYGFALTSGDTNGDSIDELVIGAPFLGAGEVHVHQVHLPAVPLAVLNALWNLYE